jgi:hypothetical protein
MKLNCPSPEMAGPCSGGSWAGSTHFQIIGATLFSHFNSPLWIGIFNQLLKRLQSKLGGKFGEEISKRELPIQFKKSMHKPKQWRFINRIVPK